MFTAALKLQAYIVKIKDPILRIAPLFIYKQS
jgi:hypothetical protein